VTVNSADAPASNPLIPSDAPAADAGLRLRRMPLVWVAVLVPAAFLFYLFFLTPSL
jgi:hypothetical protein